MSSDLYPPLALEFNTVNWSLAERAQALTDMENVLKAACGSSAKLSADGAFTLLDGYKARHCIFIPVRTRGLIGLKEDLYWHTSTVESLQELHLRVGGCGNGIEHEYHLKTTGTKRMLFANTYQEFVRKLAELEFALIEQANRNTTGNIQNLPKPTGYSSGPPQFVEVEIAKPWGGFDTGKLVDVVHKLWTSIGLVADAAPDYIFECLMSPWKRGDVRYLLLPLNAAAVDELRDNPGSIEYRPINPNNFGNPWKISFGSNPYGRRLDRETGTFSGPGIWRLTDAGTICHCRSLEGLLYYINPPVYIEPAVETLSPKPQSSGGKTPDTSSGLQKENHMNQYRAVIIQRPVTGSNPVPAQLVAELPLVVAADDSRARTAITAAIATNDKLAPVLGSPDKFQIQVTLVQPTFSF